MSIDVNSKRNFHFHLNFPAHKIHLSEHASLYLTNTMRIIAISLIGIFLPIFIYRISENYLFFSTNPVTNGFSWVLSYYLLRSVFVWVSILFFGHLIFSKLHFQLSIIISFALLIVEIFFWYLAEDNLFFILVAGVISGLKVTFYWAPYHIFFVRKLGKKTAHFGKNTSLRFFFSRIFSAATPAVGGFIILKYGFNSLFITIILLLILSCLPIALVVHEWKHKKHNIIGVLKNFLLNKKRKKITLNFFGDGIESLVYVVFWPILLYFVLNNFIKIGVLSSVSLLVSSLFVLYIGKVIDKRGTKKIHIIGIILNILLYIPRIFLNSTLLFYSLDIVDRLVSGVYALPNMSKVYEKAKKFNSSDFILYRELSIHAGIIMASFFILVMFQIFDYWRWVFVLAMIGSLMTMFIEFDDN